MVDIIKDGTGSGNLLKVDSKNRIRGYVVIEDEPTYINRIEKEMYSGIWQGAITADSSDDYIVYLKNISTTKDLVIERIKHRCTGGDGTISFFLNVIGTPGGTLTELEPSNRNASSNNTADVEYYKSNSITGLTNGRQVGSIYGKQDEEFEYAKPCGGYILPPNATFAIKASDNISTHYGGVSFYFRDTE